MRRIQKFIFISSVITITMFAFLSFEQPMKAEAGWLNDILGPLISKTSGGKTVARNSATQIDKTLHRAVENNDYELAKEAIEKGANVNSHWNNQLPLSIALNYANNHENDTKMADLLINNGADVEGWTYNGQKYFYAFTPINDDLVMYLVEHGLNVNLKGNYGLSLLMVRMGRSRVWDDAQPRSYYIQQLVNRGADVNVRAPETAPSMTNSYYYLKGENALFAAVYQNDIESARVLLYAGIDKDAKNSNGDTALSVAINRGDRPEMVTLLREWNVH